MRLTSMVLGFLVTGAASVAVAAMADSGRDVYAKTCVTCHGANGKGAIPGVPDLTARAGPLAKPESVLIEHALKGFQSPGSPMAMPPKGGNPSLTPDQIEQAVRYMRRSFAH